MTFLCPRVKDIVNIVHKLAIARVFKQHSWFSTEHNNIIDVCCEEGLFINDKCGWWLCIVVICGPRRSSAWKYTSKEIRWHNPPSNNFSLSVVQKCIDNCAKMKHHRLKFKYFIRFNSSPAPPTQQFVIKRTVVNQDYITWPFMATIYYLFIDNHSGWLF